jgi:hypothetical protein
MIARNSVGGTMLSVTELAHCFFSCERQIAITLKDSGSRYLLQTASRLSRIGVGWLGDYSLAV